MTVAADVMGIEEVMGGLEPDKGDHPDEDLDDLPAKEVDYGTVVMLLAHEFKLPKRYWLWECPLDELAAALQTYTAKRKEDNQRAMAMMGGGSKPEDDPAFISISRLRVAFTQFKQKLEARKAAQDGQ